MPALKRKLLLADDSITIQKVVNLTFADEGIEVTSVGDGDSAMEKIGDYAPDLILADVNMPGLNGYQICERIKQNPATKSIPVILLVGSFEPFDESEAYRVGADDYLTKPFQSIRQLVTKVSDLLEAAGAETDAPNSLAATQTNAENETESTVENESETANLHFFNTVEIMPEAPIETRQFDDSSFDDEMIQTSQVGSLPVDEIQKFIADSMPESSSAASASGSYGSDFDFYRTVEAEEDFGKTTPLDVNDLPAFYGEDAEQSSGAAVYEIVSEKGTDEESAPIDTAAPNDFDQYLNQTQTENQNRSEADDANDSPVWRNETISSKDSAPESFASPASPFSDAPDFSFDELDLLDLPPIENANNEPENKSSFDLPVDFAIEKTIETTVNKTEGFDRFNEFENRRAEYSEQIPTAGIDAESEQENQSATSSDAEIDRQIAALSPEVIEAIARRVAEKISDKAIREIDWEVVPQMTDIIVRRMAEEKFKE